MGIDSREVPRTRGIRRRSALLAAAAFGLTLPAYGYCRTKACDQNPAYDDVWQEEPDPPCIKDGYDCMHEGMPLHWPHNCISYSVQRDGSQSDDIDAATARDKIAQAFATWMNADCGGDVPSFSVSDYGEVACNRAEYNQDQPNANTFMFRDDDWTYQKSEDTLALTTVTYNTENGEIYDADVEFNSQDAIFTMTDDMTLAQDDFLAIVTHECGHFLGLSHSDNGDATMFPDYESGQMQQRTLHEDDQAGICDIFPPGQALSTQCTPRHGYSGECAGPKDDSGCGVSPGARGAASSGSALLLAGLAFARRRRRR